MKSDALPLGARQMMSVLGCTPEVNFCYVKDHYGEYQRIKWVAKTPNAKGMISTVLSDGRELKLRASHQVLCVMARVDPKPMETPATDLPGVNDDQIVPTAATDAA